MDDDWKDGTLILKIGKSYVTETNETRRRSRKNFITFLYLIYKPTPSFDDEWRMTMTRWRLAEPRRNHKHQNKFSLTSDLKGIENPRTTLNLFTLFILKPTSTLWHLETDNQKRTVKIYLWFIFRYTNFAPGTGLDTSLESLKGKKG